MNCLVCRRAGMHSDMVPLEMPVGPCSPLFDLEDSLLLEMYESRPTLSNTLSKDRNTYRLATPGSSSSRIAIRYCTGSTCLLQAGKSLTNPHRHKATAIGGATKTFPEAQHLQQVSER